MYVLKQLEEWKRHGTDCYIDPDRLKLYVLLSGELVWKLSADRMRGESVRVVRVCEGLDWKRAMALHLCYAVTPSSDISMAVSSYLDSIQVSSNVLFMHTPLCVLSILEVCMHITTHTVLVVLGCLLYCVYKSYCFTCICALYMNDCFMRTFFFVGRESLCCLSSSSIFRTRAHS